MEGVFTAEEFQKSSIQHFHDIQNRPNNLVNLPIDEQAKWADPITKKYATNIKFVMQCLQECEDISSNLNMTSVCNVAYLAIHSEYTSRFKQMHKNVLAEYKRQESPWCLIS